ncbi:MAG: hypothetical protein ACMG57_03400 [Candidatus Dojkabacteria bacterium]
MEGYNSKQKLYIFVAIAIFVVVNLLAVVFALPYLDKGSVKGIYTDSINDSVLISGNLDKPIQLETNKDISNNSDSLYIKELNYTLFALPQSNLNIQNLNLININSGIYYIETHSDITLFKKIKLKVSAGSRVIFDAEEGNIYVLKGQIEVLGQTYNAGFTFNLNSQDLLGNLIDKTQLLSTNKVKELNKLIATKSLFIPELNFLSTPALELKDNLTEITTDTSSYIIQGTVSPLSHVYVNHSEATVDANGTFSQKVDLKNGINDFQVSVVDEVSNTKSTNVKIILNY